METDIVEEFDDICIKLNIDHCNKANAIQKFKEVTRNTILEVSLFLTSYLSLSSIHISFVQFMSI
jgi:hypothetical protein